MAEPARAPLNEPARRSEQDAFVPTPLPSPCSHFSIKGISLRGAGRGAALVLRTPRIAGTAPRKAFVSTRVGAAGGKGVAQGAEIAPGSSLHPSTLLKPSLAGNWISQPVPDSLTDVFMGSL